MKTYGERVVSCVPWPHYHQRKSPHCPVDGRLVGPQRQYVWCWFEKNSLAPPRNRTPATEPIAHHYTDWAVLATSQIWWERFKCCFRRKVTLLKRNSRLTNCCSLEISGPASHLRGPVSKSWLSNQLTWNFCSFLSLSVPFAPPNSKIKRTLHLQYSKMWLKI